ncbi:permease [Erwinia sp. JUb26]|uniref:permease n=1 Tax=Erwinia sp. JUb26 TaxID=2485126 RepID=UPI000F4A40C6|nr:permease [Erwinia sp. JUb26]ROR11204.1 hypothetical protein EC836_103117 [Erwinia sp. JUb26]
MTIFLPLIYLLAGYAMGHTRWDIKALASLLLTRLIIPLVIIYNVSSYFHAMSGIIVVTALLMLILLSIGRRLSRDPVQHLCFFYLNIGWLGLPIVSALFSAQAVVIVIAAYVGSSIFGNSIGAGMLSGAGLDLKGLLKTPPVLALGAGIALIPFGEQIAYFGEGLYDIAKSLMSVLGMAILGIWLGKVRVTAADFRNELRPFLLRGGVIFLLVSALLLCGHLFGVQILTDNAATLYLFCLLPPAANIIVLETHYLGTGRSAKAISCGTCISIVAIAIYAAAIVLSRMM